MDVRRSSFIPTWDLPEMDDQDDVPMVDGVPSTDEGLAEEDGRREGYHGGSIWRRRGHYELATLSLTDSTGTPGVSGGPLAESLLAIENSSGRPGWVRVKSCKSPTG